MESKCPHCHGQKVVEGSIFNQADYIAPKAAFRPSGFPFYACIGTNIWMENRFYACTFCGFVWGALNGEQLMRVLSQRRGENVQKEHNLRSGEVYEIKEEEKKKQ